MTPSTFRSYFWVLAIPLLLASASVRAEATVGSGSPAGTGLDSELRLGSSYLGWVPETLVLPEVATTPVASSESCELTQQPTTMLAGTDPWTGVEDKRRRRKFIDALAFGRGERLQWTRSEKRLLWSYVGLSAVDTYQTMNIPAGSVEANPLLNVVAGDRPGETETLLFKAVTTYGTLKLADHVRSRKARRWVLVAANVIQFAVVVNNERVTGGIVF